MGDVKYINDNSGTLRNMQFLQLGMCFPYLELKISYKTQVFANLFPATRNYWLSEGPRNDREG